MPMLKKQYMLKYYVESHMCEMVDLRTKKLFLKKSSAGPKLSKRDFFVGGKIFLYSRELDIVDYGDGATRAKLHQALETCACILPASLTKDWGTIISRCEAEGMVLKRARTLYLDAATAANVGALTSDGAAALAGTVSLLLVFGCADGIQKMLALCDNAVSELGVAPPLVATSADAVAKLVGLCAATSPTATLDNCTCAVIKPHAVKSGVIGNIVDQIVQQGYELSAMETFAFTKAQAHEFLEVYKEVIPDYDAHVVELCAGLSVGMELRAESAVETFRQTVGPWDVQMAKELRPTTLRGKYGEDAVRSAVHCTDLPTDGVQECEYLFKFMT